MSLILVDCRRHRWVIRETHRMQRGRVMTIDTTEPDEAPAWRGDAIPPKTSPLARNIWSGVFATLGLSTASAAGGAGVTGAVLLGLVAAALPLLLTTWGLAWRQRLPVFAHGGFIGLAAVILVFMAHGDLQKVEAAALAQDFAAKGGASMEAAHAALAKGDAAAAKAAIEPYGEVEDERLKAIEVAAEELTRALGDKTKAARALAGKIDEKKFGPEYTQLVAVLDPAVPAQLAKEAAEAAENERLAEHFSEWDGSHPAVVEAVKRQMHDPSSFKHVETTAKGSGDTIIVSMTYRGTNAFGGVVTNQAVAVVDTDGKLHSLMTGN